MTKNCCESRLEALQRLGAPPGEQANVRKMNTSDSEGRSGRPQPQSYKTLSQTSGQIVGSENERGQQVLKRCLSEIKKPERAIRCPWLIASEAWIKGGGLITAATPTTCCDTYDSEAATFNSLPAIRHSPGGCVLRETDI
uniref:Uncharacterized protein n=2 Tax=Steinernema glaseri TaxID=37863 RepID=A0A1I8AVE6_9BILA